MKNITKEMLKIYKPVSHLDWLNYRINKNSDITFHHIIKRENGGKKTMDNGALLIPVSHQYLHLIEYKEKEIYNIINRIFKIVNEQGYEPTIEQRKLVESLLREFEDIHRWDKDSKGKLLIKYKYKDRVVVD